MTNTSINPYGLPNIVIPAEVLFNDNLSAQEKILFGLIKNLAAGECGYCWGGNKYLALHLNISQSQITRCISNLEKNEYIFSEYLQNADGITRRRIYVNLDYTNIYKHTLQNKLTEIKNKMKNETKINKPNSKSTPPRKNAEGGQQECEGGSAKTANELDSELDSVINNHKNDYRMTKTLESFRERKVNRKKRKLSSKKSSMKEKTKQRANDKAPAKKNNKPKFENKPNLDLIEVWNKQPHLRSHKNNQSKVYGEALKRLEHLRQGTLYKIVSQSELANGVFANGLPTEWPKTKWKKKYIAKAIKTLNEWCKEGNYPENKKWISSISLGDAIYNPRTGTSILMSAFKNGVQPLFNPRNYLHDERQAKIYERFEEYFGATKASTKKKIVELAKDLSDTREEYHRAWAQVNPQDYGFGDTDAQGNKISPASSLIMVGHYIKFLKGDEEINVNDFKPRANISPLSLKIDGFPWKKFVEAYQQVFNAHPISGPL